jgi:hypothetical protein
MPIPGEYAIGCQKYENAGFGKAKQRHLVSPEDFIFFVAFFAKSTVT